MMAQEEAMTLRLSVFTLFVNDQDSALRFYVDQLGFVVSEDKRLGDYRWLLVRAPHTPDVAINLELARTPEQQLVVGNRVVASRCLRWPRTIAIATTTP
jgi:catechol 2,3-dioxygenase-like lactoylglutathione lyase family enzyme